MSRVVCISAILLTIDLIFSSIPSTLGKNDNESKESKEAENEAILQDTKSMNLANTRKKDDGGDSTWNGQTAKSLWKRNSKLKQSGIRKEYNPDGKDAPIGDLEPEIRHQRQAWDRDVIASTDADGRTYVKTTISKPIIVVLILLCILIVLIALSICFLLFQHEDQSVHLARQRQDEIQFYSQESSKVEEKEPEKREFLPPSQPATLKKVGKEAIDEPSLPTEEHTPGSIRKDPSASSLEEQISAVLGTSSTRTDV